LSFKHVQSTCKKKSTRSQARKRKVKNQEIFFEFFLVIELDFSLGQMPFFFFFNLILVSRKLSFRKKKIEN
jgi:hypothetical protein